MDTWIGKIENPISLNKYLYAHSDPATFTDPSGFYSQSFGYAVEKEVEGQYKAANPHCVVQTPAVARNCLFGARAYFDANSYLKPDIMDFVNRWFNEIKPLSPSGIASGKVQIKVCSAIYGSPPFSFLANDSWTPNTAFVQDEMVFFHNIDGLIFYTDDSAVYRDVAVATLATLAVIYKNSAKKIATKLGGDAVARAAITRGIAANRAANTARMQLSFGVGFGFGLL